MVDVPPHDFRDRFEHIIDRRLNSVEKNDRGGLDIRAPTKR
jgi:hypothetical protein